MDESTERGVIRELDDAGLYERLRAAEQTVRLAKAQILEREMADLPRLVRGALAEMLVQRSTLRVDRVTFGVDADHDDGPAWDPDGARVEFGDGTHAKVDFARTGVADALVELSEHADDQTIWPGGRLVVDLTADTVRVLES